MTDDLVKLTPMSVMVLALLNEGDMHPYEMARLLRIRRDERLVKVTNGTLYHSVARLLDQGLIAEVGIDREGNRPERTTYRITDSGAVAVDDWVRRELPRIDRPAQFRVALAEAHNLERDEIRRAALHDELSLHRSGIHGARAKGVPEQFLLEIDRHQHLLDADLQWLDALLARLEDDAIPWGLAGFTDSDRYRAQRKAATQ
jgi:DNA-binding PadR family transcriptional regulator